MLKLATNGTSTLLIKNRLGGRFWIMFFIYFSVYGMWRIKRVLTARSNTCRRTSHESAPSFDISSGSSEVIPLSMNETIDSTLSLLHVENLSLTADDREILARAPLRAKFSADGRIVNIRLLKF